MQHEPGVARALPDPAVRHDLGVGQAILPPQLRPDPVTLRRLGFHLDSPVPGIDLRAVRTYHASITEIGDITQRPDKVVGFHFFFPASVMPLVEIVRGIAAAVSVIGLLALLALRRPESGRLELGRSTQVTFDPGLELDPALPPLVLCHRERNPSAARPFGTEVRT